MKACHCAVKVAQRRPFQTYTGLSVAECRYVPSFPRRRSHQRTLRSSCKAADGTRGTYLVAVDSSSGVQTVRTVLARYEGVPGCREGSPAAPSWVQVWVRRRGGGCRLSDSLRIRMPCRCATKAAELFSAPVQSLFSSGAWTRAWTGPDC